MSSQSTGEQPPKFSTRQVIIRVVLLGIVAALTVLLLVYRDQLQGLESLGYPGIILLSILSNATVLIPLPGVVFTSAMGAVFNPVWVALAAGSGAALGELSGYLAGVGGQVVLEDSVQFRKVAHWVRQHEGWTITLMALIPNPLFDMAGFVAGSSHMPVLKFLFYCAIGKILKMLAFAYLGAGLLAIFGL